MREPFEKERLPFELTEDWDCVTIGAMKGFDDERGKKMKRIAAWIALICLWVGCAESAFAKPILPSQQDDMQDDAQQEPKTVRIPDTAAEIFYEYVGERSVSAFEVSPDHPTLTSVDGVLFSKDGTRLILFPAGRTGELYSVPEGTKVIGVRYV